MDRAKTFSCLFAGLFCLVATAPAAGLELDSGTIPPGGVYEHTFTAVGSYPYHCEFHGPGMGGVVHVVVGGADSASVVIMNNFFQPPIVTVVPGGSVLWRNLGSSHTVTSSEPTPTKPATWGRIKALYR